ncbi:MAG: aldehyde dehydrogenase family protein [Sphingobacteriales bacterium]|nr:MAG: aldehyde dehydrogenase family protein [Sphingobacteriales bacterium]
MSNTDSEYIYSVFNNQREASYRIALTTAKERVEKLKRVANYLKTQVAIFQEAMYRDLRRAPIDTLAEMLLIKSEADFAIQHLSSWMKPQKVKTGLMSKGTKPYIIYEPKGVTLIIGPWNAPLACNLVPMIGSIAAGNTVIIKPSEFSPNTTAVLKKMITDLFPQNEVAFLEGDVETAKELLKLPFDHIYFTGSPQVGKLVMQAASVNLTPVTLELGGKSPVIVDQTADLDGAALKITWGKCANSGQACVAPDYVLVEQTIFDVFVEKAKQAIETMYNPEGKGIEHSEAICRIINQRHFMRVVSLLNDALEKGASVAAGGVYNEEDLYFSPTILTGVTHEMRVMQEEIFAPIMPVSVYTSKEDAVTKIRELPKPLALYIYSSNRANIDYFLKHTSAGSTVINHNMIQAGVNPYLPFGGIQNSGMGRSVGKATFTSFSNQRSVVENPTGWLDFSTISLPPYSGLYRKMISYLFNR